MASWGELTSEGCTTWKNIFEESTREVGRSKVWGEPALFAAMTGRGFSLRSLPARMVNGPVSGDSQVRVTWFAERFNRMSEMVRAGTASTKNTVS